MKLISKLEKLQYHLKADVSRLIPISDINSLKMRSTPHFEKGTKFTASDARNQSCHGSQHEFLAFLACLEVSTGSGEGSGIDNGRVCVTVCIGSSKGEAEGSSLSSHCQAGEDSS